MMTTGETVPVRLRSFEAGRRSLILLFVQSVVSGGLFAFVHNLGGHLKTGHRRSL